MGLLDEARSASGRQPWQVCGVAWVATLVDDPDEWWEAVADLTIRGEALAQTVNRYIAPESITGETIQRHRRGICRCGMGDAA